jgi:hypothetical protein
MLSLVAARSGPILASPTEFPKNLQFIRGFSEARTTWSSTGLFYGRKLDLLRLFACITYQNRYAKELSSYRDLKLES